MQNPVNRKRQSGVALFIAMIALVVLLISAIALIRSSDTALLISGNLAIKRDLTNEAEFAIQTALANFNAAGALGAENSRWADTAAVNYSSTALASNSQGIPTVLFEPSATFALTYSGPAPASYNNVTYLYLIDRLCPKTGSPTTQHCVSEASVSDSWSNTRNVTANGDTGTPHANAPVVYRISVRVTDPRQEQSFVQTTYASFGT